MYAPDRAATRTLIGCWENPISIAKMAAGVVEHDKIQDGGRCNGAWQSKMATPNKSKMAADLAVRDP